MNPTKSIFTILIIAFCYLSSEAQIGNHIPADRLPNGSTQEWEEAGCEALDGTFIVTGFFNVKDMGAYGDSIHDDTQVVLDALVLAEAQAASGGFSIIYFPQGIYRIISELSLPESTVLKGEGSTLTCLYFDHLENAIHMYSNTEYTGVEDMLLKRSTAVLETSYYIIIEHNSECWLWGVETQIANSNHVNIHDCENIEIRGCYFHSSTNYGGGGNGYGIAIGNDAIRCLIEDNVFKETRHAIVTGGQGHWNVFGYNASYNPISWTTGGLPVWATGDIELHGNSGNPGPGMGTYENLFEGNYFNWIWIDAYWGDNGIYNTFFRNAARKGGIVIEGYYENGGGGNNYYDCNNDQNLVNNYCQNLHLGVQLRYGSPWGNGNILSSNLGGTGHFARNNKTYKRDLPSTNPIVVYEDSGEEPQFLNDISYYHLQKPDFMGNLPWPYNPFDTLSRNAAAVRYESGGQVTSNAGWDHYIIVGIQDFGNKAHEQVVIYPNPNKGNFYLISNFKNISLIEIFTITGENIYSEIYKGKIHFDTKLPAGVYIMRVYHAKEYFQQKILIY